MASNILSFSTALTETVLGLSTRSARQAAIVQAMGTGTQNVAVKNAAGTAKLTGTFAGTAYGTAGTFLEPTSLASVAGDGGTAGSDGTLRVTNGSGVWWQGRFGSGNVWSYTLDNVTASITAGASTTRIRCELLADSGPPPVVDTDWLENNIVVSTSSTTPTGDEAEVLFAGRRTIKQDLFWVTPFNYPWQTDTQPPANGLYGGVQWHGGWAIDSTQTSAMWRPAAESSVFGAGKAWHRGTLGTMLQFMIKDFSKASGWDDNDYDFVDADIWIDEYGDAGKKVSFHWFCNITGSAITSFNGVSIPSISVARFKDALQRIAQRVTSNGNAYKDVIGLWEGPNEPNSTGTGGSGWNWYNIVGTMTAAQLASQYRIASQCLKAVVPDALIMGPSYSAIDNATSNSMFTFLTASAQGSDAGYGTGAGTTGADWIDVVAQHGYYNFDQSNMAGVISAYRYLRNRIEAGGAGGKPFVISEWMAFSGTWPNDFESGGDTDYWFWHNHMLSAIAFGAQIFVHFSYKNQSTFGQPAFPATAARRAKRDAFVNWLIEQDITRIARLNNGRIRVTRLDGQTRTTYEY
jgi:hypothetical protein